MRFLEEEQVRYIAARNRTPMYVYGETELLNASQALLDFPNAYGLTVRYAMKALPTRRILQLVHGWGLHIDASSGSEVDRAMAAGIPGENIQLTTQELPRDFQRLLMVGVKINACSLHQLEVFGKKFANQDARLSVRINPGLGSGHSNRTNVGGPGSSFGIWYEYIPDVKRLAEQYGLTISAVHTHIGSGGDPAVWIKVAEMSLKVAEEFPSATVLNLGGGLKVGRMPKEKSADLQQVGNAIMPAFQNFQKRTGRSLHLEIEPGTYLVARAGVIIARVIDIVDTGKEGYKFLKLDCGMTEILRPSLYGAQHPITLVTDPKREKGPTEPVVISGHCCESGDILTPAPGDPEVIAARDLPKAQIGDLIVIEDAGAYCSSMAAGGYNSFPVPSEFLVTVDGRIEIIRGTRYWQELATTEI